MVPSVYPWAPYVAQPLSDPELLTVLDVLVEKIKGVMQETALQWTRELVLLFKVRAEVGEWLYILLAPIWAHKHQACEGSAESGSKRRKGEGGHPEVAGVPAPSCNLPTEDEQRDQKVAKHDDMVVPIHLWNEHMRGSRVKISDGT